MDQAIIIHYYRFNFYQHLYFIIETAQFTTTSTNRSRNEPSLEIHLYTNAPISLVAALDAVASTNQFLETARSRAASQN